MDKTDRTILAILQCEGRITNSELAQRVGLSPAPCLERVKRLERQKAIKGYHAAIDPRKLGIGFSVFLEVELRKHDHDTVVQFMDAVQDIPEIIDCYHVTGKSDYMILLAVHDIEHYETLLLQRLSNLPGVEHFESKIVLSRIKHARNLPNFYEE